MYLSFKQNSGFTEAIKQEKSVKVFLPPLIGHADCATDLCEQFRIHALKRVTAVETSPQKLLPESTTVCWHFDNNTLV